MTDVKVSVWLWGKPGMDPTVVFVRFDVFIDDFSNKILGDLFSGLHIPHTHTDSPDQIRTGV